MHRVLTYTERQVDASARADYLVGVAVRREVAASIGAHFWVFEHEAERGRFVEFTEGESEAALRVVQGEGDDEHTSLALWREVRGE